MRAVRTSAYDRADALDWQSSQSLVLENLSEHWNQEAITKLTEMIRISVQWSAILCTTAKPIRAQCGQGI